MALLYKQSPKQIAHLARCLGWTPLKSRMCVAMNGVIPNKLYSSKESQDGDIDSRPVKFTTSEAAGWKAVHSRMGEKDDDSPPSQPYIVSLSLAVFLLYFLVLREENDIDLKLGGNNDAKTFLEYIQLKTIVDYNTKNNIPIDATVTNRINELESLVTLPDEV